MRPEKLLIVRLSSMGDIIHTFPALAYLRRALPGTQIDWIVEDRFARLLELIDGMGKIYSVNLKSLLRVSGVRRGIRKLLSLRQEMKQEPYRAVIDFQGLMKSSFMALVSGAGARVGFSNKAAREPASSAFYTNIFHINDSAQNIILKNLLLAEHMVKNVLNINPGFNVSDEYQSDFPRLKFITTKTANDKIASTLKKTYGKEIAVIHTGASRSQKVPPAKMLAELADSLYLKYHMATVFCGRGQDLEYAKNIADLCGKAEPMVYETDFTELKALIETSKIFIGGDSGPLHLAAALGKPTVGIFGPTDPLRNSPYGLTNSYAALASECRHPKCWKNCADNICLQEISADDVIRKVGELI